MIVLSDTRPSAAGYGPVKAPTPPCGVMAENTTILPVIMKLGIRINSLLGTASMFVGKRNGEEVKKELPGHNTCAISRQMTVVPSRKARLFICRPDQTPIKVIAEGVQYGKILDRIYQIELLSYS